MKLRLTTILGAGLLALRAVAAEPVSAPDVPARLDLETSIRYALDHNFAIRQARERIREQEGVIVEVRARAIPRVSAYGAYERKDTDLAESFGPTVPPPYQSWNIGIEARQALYSGGGVSAALSAQKFTRAAALLDLQATIDAALLEVRTRYYDVILAREQIGVEEQNVKLLQEQLQTARNRFEAGSVSHFDVLRAEVELANAQPRLIRTRNAFRIAIDELRRTIGYSNVAKHNLAKAPEFDGALAFTPVSYELESSLANALDARPELKRLEQIARARESGVKVASADHRPKFDLVAGYQVNKSIQSNAFADSLDGWTVGVEGNWAIFDGAATRGRVRQARSQQEQARIAVQEQRLAIEVEVRRALSALQEATELADAAQKVVDQAEEALRLADARYGAGSATQLDVLQVRVSLTEARTNQLQANYSYLVAVAAMRKAVGQADVYELKE